MNRYKLALAVVSISALLPWVASASEVTYDFTGTVTSGQGAYSGIAAGTTVSGSYTFDFDASVPGQGAGVVGAASDWSVQSDGGSTNLTMLAGGGVAQLPAPVPSALVFSSTVTIGNVTYSTAPISSWATQSYIENLNFQFFAGEDIHTGPTLFTSSTNSTMWLVRANEFVLPFSADGLPNPSDVDLAASGGFFDVPVNQTYGEVFWNFTSLSVSPVPLPAGFWLFASGLGVLLAVRRKFSFDRI